MLETLGSQNTYDFGEAAPNSGQGQSVNIIGYYIDIFKQHFFYFLLPFGLISVLGLAFAAIQKPNYLSEGKILVETQVIAPDLVRPVNTATADQRVQLIQQRVLTRANLLSIANRFGLFPGETELLDRMRQSLQVNIADAGGRQLQNNQAIAFTVGFEYPDPELATRVANEFVTLIVGEDSLSRARRSGEAVKILTDETKDVENKLEATQVQIFDAERQPHQDVSEISEQQKSQLQALATLRAELIQKRSVYSDAHPAVAALKKRIAAMEKTVTQLPDTSDEPTKIDVEGLKRQREALEKRLIEANAKLATARLGEKLDQDQQSDRLQIIEAPQLPQRPVKSKRLKMIAIAFAGAMMVGLGCAVGPELLKGTIRDRQQLSGLVSDSLIFVVPYISTRSDLIRARVRIVLAAISVIVLLLIWSGFVTAIALNLPLNATLIEKVKAALHSGRL